MTSWLKGLAHAALAILIVVGVVALIGDLSTRWIVVIVVVLALIAAARLLRVPPIGGTAPALLGLVLVPLFALVGVDALAARGGAKPVSPAASLLIGGAIIFAAARVYAEPLRTGAGPKHPWRWAIGAVVALSIVPSIVIAVGGQLNGDGAKLDAREPVSELDVVVLREDGGAGGPLETQHRGWNVRTWTGHVIGDRVQWGAKGPPPTVPRDDADRVLLLLPPPAGNDAIERWLTLADRVEPRTTPTYALLRAANAEQLLRWRKPLSRIVGRRGTALALERLGGSVRAPDDLALRVAARTPTADADLALAIAHRPALFFDGRDRTPRPLDVDQLFTNGLFHQCEVGQKLPSRCVAVQRPSDLRTGFDHLAFDTDAVTAAKVATTIYVNVTRSGNDAPNSIYLDYWWYLPDNPANAGDGAFCGPGFTIGGVTCFNHQSDWEGLTVVLDGDAPGDAPLAVHYAQHDGTARYTWAALQRLWALKPERTFAGTVSDPTRPLVFVARGTHAAYPRVCVRTPCQRNAVPGIPDRSDLEENPHDGTTEWLGNSDAGCGSTCVTALPTRSHGDEPASWNAWGGFWGTANCLFGVVCSAAQPAKSPGQQKRYERPWCAHVSFTVDGARFAKPKVGGCAFRKDSADTAALARGSTLLALGDSYSAGEGAGDYDAATNTKGNSCHRSSRAWPNVLARLRDMTPLPSIACSGALTGDVVSGRPRGQAERQRSQIGRIRGDPDLITLTIGGNDAKFGEVIRTCASVNCVAHYNRPEGDELDGKIDDLARRLPSVYRAIQRAAPRARLLVVDYPQLFPESDEAHPAGNCAAADRISGSEAAYLNEKQARLDAAIIAAARETGVDVIDVSQAFKGRELRCTGPTYMNRVRLAKRLRSGSIHPNAAGQERLARVIAAGLAALDR